MEASKGWDTNMGQRNVSGFDVVVAREGEIQKDKKEDYPLLRNFKTLFLDTYLLPYHFDLKS